MNCRESDRRKTIKLQYEVPAVENQGRAGGRNQIARAEMQRMNLSLGDFSMQLLHTMIRVNDLNESLEFYCGGTEAIR